MTDPGGWAAIVRGAAPTAAGFATALLLLRILLSSRKARPFQGLAVGVVGAAAGGAAAAVLLSVALGQDPFAGAAILFHLAAQFYLLALAACLWSWRLPLAGLTALFLFVPAIPLQLLVHAGVLPDPWGLGRFLLPPASFMLDLPTWSVGTWSRAGWDPFVWPRGMAGPGFGTGALAWILHIVLLLSLATRGRYRNRNRPGRRERDSGPAHSSK